MMLQEHGNQTRGAVTMKATEENVELLMEETAEHYEQKLQWQFEQIQQLKRANSKLKNENRGLRRAAAERRRKEADKQHFKNGKRGTRFNG